MKLGKASLLMVATLALSACGGSRLDSADKGVDRGFDTNDLSNLVAGIWVDPIGCDHWIIDDGVEGYLSQRLDPYGKPVCSGVAPPTVATGPFKGGATSTIGDSNIF